MVIHSDSNLIHFALNFQNKLLAQIIYTTIVVTQQLFLQVRFPLMACQEQFDFINKIRKSFSFLARNQHNCIYNRS